MSYQEPTSELVPYCVLLCLETSIYYCELLLGLGPTHVKPIVEYNSVRPIWSPSTVRDIAYDTVERVQRRFTRLKCLPGLRSMSYDDRLKYLNVPRLELRRLHADLFGSGVTKLCLVLQKSNPTCFCHEL